MTPQEFAAKWRRSTLSERSACQPPSIGLCRVLGQKSPTEADPHGEWYTFEKQVETTDDRKAFADVWMRGHFGWEYKGKRKNHRAAYDQLLRYRESLENPPLLVVCETDRFEVHRSITGVTYWYHCL